MTQTTTDFREWLNDQAEALRVAVHSILAEHHGSMPVQIHEDTEDGNTVKVQPTVKAKVRQEDGSFEHVELPILEDVVTQFSGGSGHHFTHPLKKGDEGLVVFGNRNIDAWHQSSGTQQAIDSRLANLADGFYIPGTKSKPNKIPNYSKETAQVRYGDQAESKVDVSKTGVLNKRGTDDKAAKVHLLDSGVLTQKGPTLTAHLDDRLDKRSPKILLNCA